MSELIHYGFGLLEAVMAEGRVNDGALETFRDEYKDLESVYAIFSKLCGLSEAEYWSLLMIHEGVTTQRDISERLSLSRQTVNSAFSQLVKKELIYLETVENNLRTKRAFLTESGILFVKKYINNMHGIEEKVWHMMKEEERTQLTKLIRNYKELMKEALQQYQKIE